MVTLSCLRLRPLPSPSPSGRTRGRRKGGFDGVGKGSKTRREGRHERRREAVEEEKDIVERGKGGGERKAW